MFTELYGIGEMSLDGWALVGNNMATVSLNTKQRKLKSGERVAYWYLHLAKPQRIILCIGVLAVLVMCLYPPWTITWPCSSGCETHQITEGKIHKPGFSRSNWRI